ncbi:MAG: tRNA (adenosine(37)-N6)-threonylcarbamoyltransferase complex ATPase subunit type 1 TsaE [Dehalococcoidia bacterium]
MSIFTYLSTSEKQTQILGQAISQFISKDTLLLLKGDLGTGKTTLTQSIVKEIDSALKVKSPTFVIAHEYRSEVLIYHVDLYRIENEIDFYDIGILELIREDTICIIEWPDLFIDMLPQAYIIINIEILDDTSREFKLISKGAKHEKFLRNIKSRLKTNTIN